jgi:hypothetical protein
MPESFWDWCMVGGEDDVEAILRVETRSSQLREELPRTLVRRGRKLTHQE